MNTVPPTNPITGLSQSPAAELAATTTAGLPKTVGIFLFPEVEPLDFAGPYEVFAATRPERVSEVRLLRVRTVAEEAGLIRCRYGLQVVADEIIADETRFDVLILPGGPGTHAVANSQRVQAWIRRQAATAENVVSVCTGSFLLAKAGLLDGLAATTHWAHLDRLAREHPQIHVRRGVRWVNNGKLLTSAGVSAGIDVSFHVIKRLFGDAVAQATAEGIEYSEHLEK